MSLNGNCRGGICTNLSMAVGYNLTKIFKGVGIQYSLSLKYISLDILFNFTKDIGMDIVNIPATFMLLVDVMMTSNIKSTGYWIK